MRLPEDFSGATNDSHLVQLWLNGRPDTTKAIYHRTATAFLKTLVKSIREATVADLVAWMEKLEGADATKARVIGTIKSLLTFAHMTGYTVFNVGRALKSPKLPSNLHKRIVEEDVMKDILKSPARDRDQALVQLFYGLGLRSGEVCNLTFGDIQGTHLTVLGKGSKRRTLKAPLSLIKALKALRPKGVGDECPVFRSVTGRGFSPGTMWWLIRSLTDEAGFSISPHWFRHAHASHSLDHGCPIHVLQHSLGHSSVASTTPYLHVRPTAGSSEFISLDRPS